MFGDVDHSSLIHDFNRKSCPNTCLAITSDLVCNNVVFGAYTLLNSAVELYGLS